MQFIIGIRNVKFQAVGQFYSNLLTPFSPPELQFYTSAAAVIMLIPAWVFLMVCQHLIPTFIVVLALMLQLDT